MRNVHHWSKEAAVKVRSKFNIRKRKNKEDKKKDYHCQRRCPLSDCHSIVCRLPAHPTIRWQEERFRTKEWKGRGEREEFRNRNGSSSEESVEKSDDKGQSEDGGKRDKKTVKHHSSQLFGMLKAIDDQQDLKSLLDVKLVRVVF